MPPKETEDIARDAFAHAAMVTETVPYVEGYEPYLLSRRPTRSETATRGCLTTSFTKDLYRYSVFVGFAKRPTSRNPYVRFLIVRMKHQYDSRIDEGVVLIEDPFGGSTSPSGTNPGKLLHKKSRTVEQYELAMKCYKIAYGLQRMFCDLGVLSGKDFEPFLKTGELLSLPIMAEIMVNMVNHLDQAPKLVLANMYTHVAEKRGESIPLSEYLRYHPEISENSSKRILFEDTSRLDPLVCELISDFILTHGNTDWLDKPARTWKGKDPPRRPLSNAAANSFMTIMKLHAAPEDAARLLADAKALSCALEAWDAVSGYYQETQLHPHVRMLTNAGVYNSSMILQACDLGEMSELLVRLYRSQRVVE